MKIAFISSYLYYLTIDEVKRASCDKANLLSADRHKTLLDKLSKNYAVDSSDDYHEFYVNFGPLEDYDGLIFHPEYDMRHQMLMVIDEMGTKPIVFLYGGTTKKAFYERTILLEEPTDYSESNDSYKKDNLLFCDPRNVEDIIKHLSRK